MMKVGEVTLLLNKVKIRTRELVTMMERQIETNLAKGCSKMALDLIMKVFLPLFRMLFSELIM